MNHEILSRQTTLFTECVRDCFRDMLGMEIVLDSSKFDDHPFAPKRPMIALIHFTGLAQGDFVLNLEEETAVRLIDAWSAGMGASAIRELRSEFGGMLKEVLNTAVGMAIPALEEKFGRLMYHPPLVVYGEMDPPSVPSGTLTLRSGAGLIDCCFVLDMAGDDAEKKLIKVMEDLDNARQEMSNCYKLLRELVAQSHGAVVDPALLRDAEMVLSEVRDMLESAGSKVD
jgi:CheY-specific phosphatase CheX